MSFQLIASHTAIFLLLTLFAEPITPQTAAISPPTGPLANVSYTNATGDPLSFTLDQVAAAKTAAPAAAGNIEPAAITPQARAPTEYRRGQVQHNKYRALHSAPRLTWTNSLANSAASWASKCVFAHSNPNGAYGENLYVTSQRNAGGPALVDAVKAWYAEIKDYDFNNPGFSSNTGHFTQVVWKASRQLGCAVQDCANIQGFTAGTMVVCQYQPPGNVIGQFPQNVLRN